MASVAAQGDPRRPNEVHSFIREAAESPFSLSYYYSVISMLFGAAAFTMKWKIAAWVAFIFCGAAFATNNNSEAEVRNMSWAIMTATSAMVTTYAGLYQQQSSAYTPPSDQPKSSPIDFE